MSNHRLLPRYRTHADQTRALGRAILETDTPIRLTPTKITSTMGDPAELRGIPAIGRNVGGAITGTRPDTARLDP